MNSRGERFKKLCREAGRQLNVKADSELAKHVAILRLMREQLQVKLLNGAHVDPADVLKLDEALKGYLPVIELPKLEIGFVRRLHECCRACGESQEFICRKCGYHETEADACKPPPLPAVANPLPSEPAAPSASTNVVPLNRSIHDHAFAPTKSMTVSPFVSGFDRQGA